MWKRIKKQRSSSQRSSSPKSISTFSPGLNAGRPVANCLACIRGRDEDEFTSIRAARASEGVTQVTASTAAGGLRCGLSSLLQPFLLLIHAVHSVNLNNTIRIEQHNLQPLGKLGLFSLFLSLLDLCQSAGTSLARLFLPGRRGGSHRITHDGPFAIGGCEKGLCVDRRGGWGVQRPKSFLCCLLSGILWVGLRSPGEGYDKSFSPVGGGDGLFGFEGIRPSGLLSDDGGPR